VILTVTPNAAIDRTATVARLGDDPDGATLEESVQAGGKGLNAARVLRALGCPVRAVVVVGGRSGAWLEEDLRRAGLSFVAVEAPGETRTCLEIVEAGTGRVRQVHGPGVEASPEVAERLLGVVDRELRGASWLAICGRLARGLPAETAAELVRLARRRGVPAAVDTSDAALAPAWAADPDCLRVNRQEAAAALGVAARELPAPPYPRAGRPGLGVISDGGGPCLAWQEGGRTWRIAPPRVRLRNPIGCGDAMLAGLLDGLRRGRPPGESLRFATALAAAAAESPRAGEASPERARELAPAVEVRELT
jgi:tagatose 6-phosphate kinase